MTGFVDYHFWDIQRHLWVNKNKNAELQLTTVNKTVLFKRKSASDNLGRIYNINVFHPIYLETIN